MALRTARVQIYGNNDHAKLEEGDLIEYPRWKGMYSHWAVYTGEWKVVHLTGIDDGPMEINAEHVFTICGKRFAKACVKEDYFWRVGTTAYRHNECDKKFKPRPKLEIVQKARSMLGRVSYNFIYKNCEHFATLCRYGEERSEQVRSFIVWTTIGVAVGVAMILLFR